jgi:hypothetical protein
MEKVKQKKRLIAHEGDLDWSSMCTVQEEEEHRSIPQMLRVSLQLIIVMSTIVEILMIRLTSGVRKTLKALTRNAYNRRRRLRDWTMRSVSGVDVKPKQFLWHSPTDAPKAKVAVRMLDNMPS